MGLQSNNEARQLKPTGAHSICGLDEAGRGALAGPLVVAAVAMPVSFNFRHVAPDIVVKDSKLLSTSQRMLAYHVIERFSYRIAFEVISAEEINRSGINWANTEGFRRLIQDVKADQYIIDGRWKMPDLGAKASITQCMVHADESIPAVMAAGIAAKVKRDLIMQQLHLQYPLYQWSTNTGHGTQQHINAIKTHGLCGEHRLQFVRTALKV
jgi:ribonuclease HII